ncbi:MAG: GNAT family N-acetyltransferase [Oscillospiraceae bacterium]|nr:GNAT family N-acetyltransferase [Oscillospiraceae bacterium]
MEERIKSFHELSADELFEIYKLRVSVFVVEQSCAYQEVDDEDKKAYHIGLYENGKLMAYCRVFPRDGDEALIGRVIAVKRRCGLGTYVVSLAIKAAREKLGAKTIRVEAQTYAAPMYEKLGFEKFSQEYLEDGIPHVSMILE